jgi:hypothetical protein
VVRGNARAYPERSGRTRDLRGRGGLAAAPSQPPSGFRSRCPPRCAGPSATDSGTGRGLRSRQCTTGLRGPRRSPGRPAGQWSAGSCTARTRGWEPTRIVANLGVRAFTVHRPLRGPAATGPAGPGHPGAAGPGPALRTRRAGHLVHVDIKNLGKIPNGGGHLTQGRQQGKRSRQATAPEARGYGYLHTALDDHSRAGLHRDPRRRARRHGFWRRAVDLVRQRRRHRRKPWWSATAGAMSWSSGRRVRRRAGRLLAERGQRASRTAGRQESDEVLTSTTWWASGVLRVRR